MLRFGIATALSRAHHSASVSVSALEGWKEFADGWFARHQKSAQAALEVAKHIGDANAPSDILREYQSWFTRAMELLAEDGSAYQR